MIKDVIHYCYLRFKYFFRIRKSRGFGIHSPFVFHIVTHIIKDKHPFYVFDLLTQNFQDFSFRDVKYAKIVYKVINELNINHVYCLSDRFIVDKLILNNAGTKFYFMNSILDVVDAYKVIYIGDEDLNLFADESTINILKSSNTLIVLSEMYRNEETLIVFKKLKNESTVCLDLFYRGLLFFDSKLQKGSYSIKV